MFFNGQLGKHAWRIFLRAQALATSLSSIFFPQHDLPIHKCLLFSLGYSCGVLINTFLQGFDEYFDAMLF